MSHTPSYKIDMPKTDATWMAMQHAQVFLTSTGIEITKDKYDTLFAADDVIDGVIDFRDPSDHTIVMFIGGSAYPVKNII